MTLELQSATLLTDGTFATDLAARGYLLAPTETMTVDAFLNGAHPTGDLLLSLTAGNHPSVRDAVDSWSFTHNKPSCGLELHPRRIVCGPVVAPGASACYRCFQIRRQQHSTAVDVDFADPAMSTVELDEGYGEPHLALAGVLLRHAWADLRLEHTREMGAVRTFDLVTGRFSVARTVSVDRCDRCSDRFQRPSVDNLFSHLPDARTEFVHADRIER